MSDIDCPTSFEHLYESQYYEQHRYLYTPHVIDVFYPANDENTQEYTSYSRDWFNESGEYLYTSHGKEIPKSLIYVKPCTKRKKLTFTDLPESLQRKFPKQVQINGAYSHPTYGVVYSLGPAAEVDAPEKFYDQFGNLVYNNGYVAGWTPNPSNKQVAEYSDWYSVIKRIA